MDWTLSEDLDLRTLGLVDGLTDDDFDAYVVADMRKEMYGKILQMARTAKRNDKEKGIYDVTEYITVRDIITTLLAQKGRCAYAECCVDLDWQPESKNSLGKSTVMSLDRLDNILAHTKSNCVVACLHCNHTGNFKNFE